MLASLSQLEKLRHKTLSELRDISQQMAELGILSSSPGGKSMRHPLHHFLILEGSNTAQISGILFNENGRWRDLEANYKVEECWACLTLYPCATTDSKI